MLPWLSQSIWWPILPNQFIIILRLAHRCKFPLHPVIKLLFLVYCLPCSSFSNFASHNCRFGMIDKSILFRVFNFVNYVSGFFFFRCGVSVSFKISSALVLSYYLCLLNSHRSSLPAFPLRHKLGWPKSCTDLSRFWQILIHLKSFRFGHLLLLVGYTWNYVENQFHLCLHLPHHVKVFRMKVSVYLLPSHWYHSERCIFPRSICTCVHIIVFSSLLSVFFALTALISDDYSFSSLYATCSLMRSMLFFDSMYLPAITNVGRCDISFILVNLLCLEKIMGHAMIVDYYCNLLSGIATWEQWFHIPCHRITVYFISINSIW